jgi:hypothetical protein
LVEDERIISFDVLREWFFGESGLFAFWLWCFGETRQLNMLDGFCEEEE